MKYKCNKENKIIYKIHHRLKRNRFTKKNHLRSQMLPFASLCLPDNIIPIPEAGIKNLQFSFILISTLCASLLTSLPLPRLKYKTKRANSVLSSGLVSKLYTGTSKLTLSRVTTDAVKWWSWRRYLIKDGLRRRVTARNQRLTAF